METHELIEILQTLDLEGNATVYLTVHGLGLDKIRDVEKIDAGIVIQGK